MASTPASRLLLTTNTTLATGESLKYSMILRALEPPPEATDTPPAEVDWAGARRLLGEIEALLAGSHLRAHQLVDENAALLHSALGDFGAELERQVRQFRYPEALEILQRARSQHPELAP